jgi:hypothetical protein
MIRNVTLIRGLLALSVLAGCGGGGASSPSMPPNPAPTASLVATAPVAPTPKPSPTSSPASTQATATGTVVDYAANTPLSGVKVAIAPFTLGAAATQVATTNASGQFTFTTAPGTYYLVIGSDSATDTTTTLHTKIVLAAGANALTAPMPPAEPDVTLTAAQQSGNFRLTALAGNQLSCFTGTNQGRAAASLTLEIPDEYLTESATAVAQEGTAENLAEPTPLFAGFGTYSEALGNAVATEAIATLGGFTTCSSWTGPAFSFVSTNTEVFALATNPANIYFGANMIAGSPSPNGTGAQEWAVDPR